MNKINLDRYCERVINTDKEREDMWKEMVQDIEEEEQRLEEEALHRSDSGKRAAIELIDPAQDKRQRLTVLELEYQNPKTSPYYKNIVEAYQWTREFKPMFGMPHNIYLQLLAEWKSDHNFQMWYSHTDRLYEAPAELLLLGSLRALKGSKNLSFTDMGAVTEDKFIDIMLLTRIKPCVHLKFFHYFMAYGSISLRTKYVVNCHRSVTNVETYDFVQCLVKSGLFGILDQKTKKRIKDMQKTIL